MITGITHRLSSLTKEYSCLICVVRKQKRSSGGEKVEMIAKTGTR